MRREWKNTMTTVYMLKSWSVKDLQYLSQHWLQHTLLWQNIDRSQRKTSFHSFFFDSAPWKVQRCRTCERKTLGGAMQQILHVLHCWTLAQPENVWRWTPKAWIKLRFHLFDKSVFEISFEKAEKIYILETFSSSVHCLENSCIYKKLLPLLEKHKLQCKVRFFFNEIGEFSWATTDVCSRVGGEMPLISRKLSIQIK